MPCTSDAEEQALYSSNNYASSPISPGPSPRARTAQLSRKQFTPSRKRSLGQFSPSSPGFKLAFADVSQFSPPVQQDHVEDVDEAEEFQDAIGGSPEGNEGIVAVPHANDSTWDEAEFQRLAADRSSRYSAATHFDDEADGASSLFDEGGSREGAEHTTYGHARETSVGSSVWEGKGASADDSRHSSSNTGNTGRRLPLRTMPPPPSLFSSSFALQQLTENPIKEELDSNQLAAEPTSSISSSSLLNSAYNSPNLSEDAEEHFGIPQSVSVENEEFDIINPLRSNISSLYDRRVVDVSSSDTLPRSSSSPRVMMSGGDPSPSPSDLQNASQMSKPSVPPPSGTLAFQRRQRPPVLSFDGAVADEEALLNLGNSNLGSSTSGDPEQAPSTDANATRGTSTLGPTLRKNEPAPWELEQGDETLAEDRAVISPGFLSPHSPANFIGSSPVPLSPWGKLTRGSLEHGRGDGRIKAGAALSVRLRRPSGEVNSLSAFDGDTRRRAASASGPGLLLGPQTKTKFGGKPWSAETDSGASPLFTGWTSPDFLARPRQGSKASLGSLGLKTSHLLRIDSAGSPSQVHLGLPEVVQVSSTSSSTSASSHATPSTASQSKKSSSAGKVLKGLGLGGSSTGSSRQEGSGTGSDGDAIGAKQARINNIKLVKALKKKVERDELSLERGISSEGYAKVIEEEEERAKADLPKESPVVSVRPQSPALSSRRPSVDSTNPTAWRAAEANRGLVNPFTKLPTVSEPAAEALTVVFAPSVAPATPTRTTSRRKSVDHAHLQPTSSREGDAGQEAQMRGQTGSPLDQRSEIPQPQTLAPQSSSSAGLSSTAEPSLDEGFGVASGFIESGNSDAAVMTAASLSADTCSSAVPATTPASSDSLLYESEAAAIARPGSAVSNGSPRHQRQFSLLPNSSTVTSMSSVSVGRSGGNSSPLFASREGTTSPVPRGIGVGYRKSSGLGSPSLGTTSLPLRSPASTHFSTRSVAANARSPAHGSTTFRGADFQDVPVHRPSTPLSTKPDSSMIYSTVGPSDSHSIVKRAPDVPTPGSEVSSAVHLENHSGDSTDTSTIATAVSVDTPAASSGGAPLPIPGSHEGVAYKLISLEQAQAQRIGKDLELAPLSDPETGSFRSTVAERSQLSKAPHPSFSADSTLPDQQYHSAGESASAASYLHASGAQSAKALKNKKSGLLKLFGRKQSTDSSAKDFDRHQESAPAFPSVPQGTMRARSTLDDLPSPLPSAAESVFISSGDDSSTEMSRGDSVPALGALRPMSSIFASLSPVLGGGLLPLETLTGEDEEDVPSDEAAAARSTNEAATEHHTPASAPAGGRPKRPLRPDGFGGLTASFTARSGELHYDRDPTPTPIIATQYSSEAGNHTSSPLLGQTPATPMTGDAIPGLHSPWGSPLPPEIEKDREAVPTETWPRAAMFDTDSPRFGGQESSSRSTSSHSRHVYAWQGQSTAGDRGTIASSIASHPVSLAKSSNHLTGQASPSLLDSSTTEPASKGVQAQLRDRICIIESRMSELAAELSHLKSLSRPLGSVPPSPDPSGGVGEALTGSGDGKGTVAQPIAPCVACGCTCAETGLSQPPDESEEILLRPDPRSLSGSSMASPGGASLMDRGRAVKKRAEDAAGRFGGGP